MSDPRHDAVPSDPPRGQAAPTAPGQASSSARPKAFPGLLHAVALLALLLAGSVSAAAALGVVETLTGGAFAPGLGWSIAIINTLGFGSALAVGLGLARRPVTSIFPLRGVSPRVLLGLLIGGPGLAILSGQLVVLLLRLAPRSWLEAPLETFLDEMIAMLLEDRVGSFVALVVTASVLEEAFFRGLLLPGFEVRYGARRAVLLSAALFSLAHLNPVQFVSTFLLGLVLGWLFVRTRSILPCVALHALNNGTAFASLVALKHDAPTDALAPAPAGWIAAAVIAVGAGARIVHREVSSDAGRGPGGRPAVS